VRINVRDDGCGFDAKAQALHGQRFGLVGMAERARAVGGDVIVRSRRGKGTDVIVRIPTVDDGKVDHEYRYCDG